MNIYTLIQEQESLSKLIASILNDGNFDFNSNIFYDINFV